MKPFPNAPLLEVVAELHWQRNVPQINAMNIPGPSPIPVLADTTDERFFESLAANWAEIGFERFERIVPVGFPTLPHQAVCRFKSGRRKSEILQAGPGMFSVNGLKPYDSWETFQPLIAKGLELLNKSQVHNIPSTFTELILKYVNLFDESLLEGKTALGFCNQIAGLQLNVPDVFTRLMNPGSPIDCNLSLNVPLSWGSKLQMRLGDGRGADMNGVLQRGVIVDIQVSITENLPKDIAGVLTCFDRAHSDLQRIFLEMTGPIEHLMMKEVG
jgi:uncharacterized protein (TIGR04255 family)